MSSKSIKMKGQTNSISNVKSSRIWYLDHLRVFIVLMVLVIHAAMAFAVFSPPWNWVNNNDTHLFFDFISLMSDNFLMPTLFFIAGFFTLFSLQSRNMRSFFKQRILRLGIPYIIGIIVVGPLVIYISYLARGVSVPGYLEYWFLQYMTGEFHPGHLWFLSVLLVITFGFSVIYYMWRSAFEVTDPGKRGSFPLKYFVVFPVYIGLIFFTVNLFVSDFVWIGLNPWGFEYFNVLQVTRAVMYIGYFILGVYGFKHGWFMNSKGVLLLVGWGGSTVVLSVVMFVFYGFFYYDIESSLVLMLVRAMLWSFFCFCILMTWLLVFQRFFNKPSRVGRKLSANSYAIYLIHVPLVVGLQWWLAEVVLFLFVKFLIVLGIGFLGSYLLSEYVVRRIPGLKRIL